MRRAPVVRKGMGWVRSEPQDLDFFLTFTDSFLGRCRPLALDATRNILPPPDQLAQIKMPLKLLKAAEWFFAARRLTGRKRHRENSPAPLSHMLVQFIPGVPVRIMFGFVAFVCPRIAAAPLNMRVPDRTTWRCAECVMDRVTRGHVRRLQVRLMHALARARCLLIRTAANAG